MLHVVCKSPAGKLDDPVPYAVAVTLEVGEDLQVAVYERVKERLRQPITPSG